MIETTIEKIKGDWKEILNDCRFTVNKLDIDKEPSEEFKKEILISEHSPIRDMIFKWRWEKIPHWVGVHWVRHKWEKYVATEREDRTGIPRHELKQDHPQSFKGEANIQHLIDTMRKRLCYCSSKETRGCAESLKLEIYKYEPLVANVLQKNCIYRGGCPEGKKSCGYWNKFVEENTTENLLDIENRYRLENERFYGKR